MERKFELWIGYLFVEQSTCGIATIGEHASLCVVASPASSTTLHHHAEHRRFRRVWCNLDISKRGVCLQPLRAFKASYNFEGFSLPGVAFSTAALLPIGTLSTFWQGTGSSKLRLFSRTFYVGFFLQMYVKFGSAEHSMREIFLRRNMSHLVSRYLHIRPHRLV